MTPEEKQQFDEMRTRVNEIYQWVQDRKRNQLTLPLDAQSVNVLNEAFRTRYFDAFKVRELFLKPGFSVNPSQEGQIVYHENSGTQIIKIYLDGGVKTISAS